jgi:hypothetical protein
LPDALVHQNLRALAIGDIGAKDMIFADLTIGRERIVF